MSRRPTDRTGIQLPASVGVDALPYIDEHGILIRAAPDDVWSALVAVLRTHLATGPAPLMRFLRPMPAHLRGDWRRTPGVGDSLPGFEVVDSRAPECLVLRGEHRFSRYVLVFDVELTQAGESALRARSWGAFPGLAGRAYRAVVIGTGGHRIVVRRMLRIVAARA